MIYTHTRIYFVVVVLERERDVNVCENFHCSKGICFFFLFTLGSINPVNHLSLNPVLMLAFYNLHPVHVFIKYV